jgi:cardiolipin synthase
LQIYQSGYELYDAMLAAIDAARENIYLETYIWKADVVGQAFKEHLVQKAGQGVAVYVIFDGFANTVVPHDFKAFPSTIRVLQYQALHRPWHVFDPRRYALDHRKQLVVDGSIGFLGGYNLGNLYAASWRDTHLSVYGPAAADLARSFVRFWNQHRRKRDHIHKHYPCRFNPFINVRETSALQLTFPIRDMYIDAINRAEQTIRLTNAYFVPDRTLLEALKAAAQRGVDVQVLVPWTSNHRLVDWFARASFAECLQAGIRLFAYQRMLHAKTCTIDGQWTTIGTANLDRLSSVGNYESNVEIYSKTLARQMETLFLWDLKHALEITRAQWMKRPGYVTLEEALLRPFRFLM